MVHEGSLEPFRVPASDLIFCEQKVRKYNSRFFNEPSGT
jgi:hypothetical protein